MKLRFLILTSVVLLLAAGENTSRKADTTDRRKLQGTWTATAIEFQGRNALGDAIKELQLSIAGDKMSVSGDGAELDKYAEFTCKLDTTTVPKSIDITLAAGTDKGTALAGIYELTDDEWKLCVTVFGGGRPREFKSAADSQSVLAVFKRSSP
jgi:uncharacterized protein (TIGR03067 family)